MSAPPTTHVVSAYKALSGPELLEIIFTKMDELKARLIASGKFDPVVSYPNAQIMVSAQIHLPIMTDRDFAECIIIDEQPLPADQPAEDLVVSASVIESSDNPPDLIREMHGLPVTVTEIGKGHGGMPTIREVEIKRSPKRGAR